MSLPLVPAPVRVGVVMHAGKRERFWDAFEAHVLRMPAVVPTRLQFVNLWEAHAPEHEYDTELTEEAASIHVLVQKMAGCDPAPAIVARVRAPVIDAPSVTESLRFRFSVAGMLQQACAVANSRLPAGLTVATPAFGLLSTDWSDERINSALAAAGISFPLVAKSVADGRHDSIALLASMRALQAYMHAHVMQEAASASAPTATSVALPESGGVGPALPTAVDMTTSWIFVPRHSPVSQAHTIFVQRYIPSRGVLWKVCVMGEAVSAAARLPGDASIAMRVGEAATPMHFPRLSKQPAGLATSGSAPSHRCEHGTRGDCVWKVAADAIRGVSGLSIFNFDVLEAADQPGAYHIVDVNYFPSFAGVPRRYEALLTHLLHTACKNAAGDAEACQQLAADTAQHLTAFEAAQFCSLPFGWTADESPFHAHAGATSAVVAVVGASAGGARTVDGAASVLSSPTVTEPCCTPSSHVTAQPPTWSHGFTTSTESVHQFLETADLDAPPPQLRVALSALDSGMVDATVRTPSPPTRDGVRDRLSMHSSHTESNFSPAWLVTSPEIVDASAETWGAPPRSRSSSASALNSRTTPAADSRGAAALMPIPEAEAVGNSNSSTTSMNSDMHHLTTPSVAASHAASQVSEDDARGGVDQRVWVGGALVAAAALFALAMSRRRS